MRTTAWQGLFHTILLHFLHPWRSEQEVEMSRRYENCLLNTLYRKGHKETQRKNKFGNS